MGVHSYRRSLVNFYFFFFFKWICWTPGYKTNLHTRQAMRLRGRAFSGQIELCQARNEFLSDFSPFLTLHIKIAMLCLCGRLCRIREYKGHGTKMSTS